MSGFWIENNGPELASSTYWDSAHAHSGALVLSINAHAFRLLVPDGFDLPELGSSTRATISVGTWPEAAQPYAFEIRPTTTRRGEERLPGRAACYRSPVSTVIRTTVPGGSVSLGWLSERAPDTLVPRSVTTVASFSEAIIARMVASYSLRRPIASSGQSVGLSGNLRVRRWARQRVRWDTRIPEGAHRSIEVGQYQEPPRLRLLVVGGSRPFPFTRAGDQRGTVRSPDGGAVVRAGCPIRTFPASGLGCTLGCGRDPRQLAPA